MCTFYRQSIMKTIKLKCYKDKTCIDDVVVGEEEVKVTKDVVVEGW